MKTRRPPPSSDAIPAIVSLRSGRSGEGYRGISVGVPSLSLRLRVRGADMRADLARALGVCRAAGWEVVFTEATKRAIPDIRFAELVEQNRRKSR